MSIPALTSRIESVVVYREGAMVSRSAVLEAGPGGFPEEIRIANLPLALDDGSVRVRVVPADGGAGPLPAATDLRVGLDVPPADDALPPPKDEELEAARREAARLEDVVGQLAEAAGRLEALEIKARPRGPRGEPPRPSPTDARLVLLDFRRRELLNLWSEQAGRERELEKARDRLAELEFRHQLASTARQTREHELRKAAFVRLRPPDASPAAPRCRIVAEYLVPGARWSPAYSLRFEPDFSAARVSLRALVCQKSGEDWAGVRLTLSTASALAWTDLPELPSLRIGRRQAPPARPGWREPPAGAEALFADYDRARAAAAAEPPPPPPLEAAAMGALMGAGARMDDLACLDEKSAEYDEEAAEAPPEPPREKKKKGRRPEPEAVCSEQAMPYNAPQPCASMPPPAPCRAAPAGRPQKSMALRSADMMKDMASPADFGGAGDDRNATSTEQAELSAPADLLAYGTLRMRGPDDSARGKIRPAAPSERYREMLAALRVSAEGSVEDWVRSAESSARGPLGLPLPPGHSIPAGDDGFDYAWRGEQPSDVPSDGAWHSLPLLEADAASAMRHVAVPRESTNVFRFAAFTNPLRAPLLPGPADVYVGSGFALTANLRTVAPGGQAEIGLGVEEAVKIARNTRFAERAAGLLGGQMNLEHEIVVEAENHLKRPVDLEVRERLPVPRTGDDQVQVEVLEAAPKWEDWIQKESPVSGSKRWRLQVAPGAKETLRARYVVKIPSKKELAGGNRRES